MKMNLKVHHIGIKVKDLKKSIGIYEKMGYTKISNIVIDTIQNNRIVFVKSSEGFQILELIEPIDSTSSICHFDDGYHHICYETDSPDFKEKFDGLKIGKIFTKPVMVPAIEGRKALFGCLSNGTFIEFLVQ